MIRRTFAALRSLLSDGRPDDLCALIEATAAPDPPSDPCHPCDEYAREFHRVVSIWAELMADARVAEFGDEDWAEWQREMAWTEGER